MQGVSYVVACQAEPRLDLVQQFYAEVILGEFTEGELEDVEIWVRILLDGGSSARYILSIGMLVRDEDQKVLGGCVQELYRDSRCGLISYCAVHPCMRGKGCAGFIMKHAFTYLSARCVELFAEPLTALFIEVLQVRDAELPELDEASANITHHAQGELSLADCTSPTNAKVRSDEIPPTPKIVKDCSGHAFEAASLRQKVWKKLNFLPLDFDFVSVGRMRGKRYTLAIWSEKYSADTGMPANALLRFLVDFTTGILDEEDSDDFTEIEKYAVQLKDVETVGLGEQYWR
jgi:GNAT superfamily N-acetyltransferase